MSTRVVNGIKHATKVEQRNALSFPNWGVPAMNADTLVKEFEKAQTIIK